MAFQIEKEVPHTSLNKFRELTSPADLHIYRISENAISPSPADSYIGSLINVRVSWTRDIRIEKNPCRNSMLPKTMLKVWMSIEILLPFSFYDPLSIFNVFSIILTQQPLFALNKLKKYHTLL
jgi:hypothetical protein